MSCNEVDQNMLWQTFFFFFFLFVEIGFGFIFFNSMKEMIFRELAFFNHGNFQ